MADEFNIHSPNIMLPITMGDFEKAIKQARAEVLAACIEALKDGVPIGAGHGVGYIYNVLSNVQPAASALEAHDKALFKQWQRTFDSAVEVKLKQVTRRLVKLEVDLEALLREAELKGRIAQLNMMKGDDAGGMWFPDPGTHTINDRIAELEKARAEGERA